MFQIVYEYDTELSEYEAKTKGYRNDAVVIIGEKKYRMHIIDFNRLCQDYATEVENDGSYLNEPNLIIVKEVTKQEIERTVKNLIVNEFFDELGSMKT